MISSISDIIHALVKAYQSMEGRRFDLMGSRHHNPTIEKISAIISVKAQLSSGDLQNILAVVCDVASAKGKHAFVINYIKSIIEHDLEKIDTKTMLVDIESQADAFFRIPAAESQASYMSGVFNWMGSFVGQVADDVGFYNDCKLIVVATFELYKDHISDDKFAVLETRYRPTEKDIVDFSFEQNEKVRHLEVLIEELRRSEVDQESKSDAALSTSVHAKGLMEKQQEIEKINRQMHALLEGSGEYNQLELELKKLKTEKQELIRNAAGDKDLQLRLKERVAELQSQLVSTEGTLKAAFQEEQQHWKRRLEREKQKASRRRRESMMSEKKINENWLVESIAEAKIIIDHGKKLVELSADRVELDRRLAALNKIANQLMPVVAPDACDSESLAKAESALTTLPSHMNDAASCYLKLMNYAGGYVGAYNELYDDRVRVSFLAEHAKLGVTTGMEEKSKAILRELESMIYLFYERCKVQAGLRHIKPPKEHAEAVKLHEDRQDFFKALAEAAESLVKCYSNLAGEGYIKKQGFKSWPDFVETIGPFAAKNYLHIGSEVKKSISKSKLVAAGMFSSSAAATDSAEHELSDSDDASYDDWSAEESSDEDSNSAKAASVK